MTTIDPKFIISEDMLNKCKKFGIDSVNSSLDKYASRHGFDISDPNAVERALTKFSSDICCGKIGEELVFKKYLEKIPGLTAPDYNIYSKKNKSWEPDLKDMDSNLTIAVKSQDIRSKLDNEESWVFQLGNKGKDTDKAIFNKSDGNHYVALVSLNIPKRFGEIKAVIKLSWIHNNNLFREMNIKELNGNKCAIYYDDLKSFSNELWQL